MRAWAVVTILLVALAAAPVDAKLEDERARALAYLAGHADEAGPLAANLAEAAAANGRDPAEWPSPHDPVAAHVQVPGPDAANISLLRPLRALALANDPRAGPGGELTARVQQHVGASGYGSPATLNDDAYAILALAAAAPLDDGDRFQPMAAHLRANQHAGGGWGWAVGGGPGTDMTGLVVEALHVAGSPPEAGPVLAFLATTRDARGGFAESPGGARNCESTAWGIRATLRLGAEVDPDDWGFLLGLQRDDGGFAHAEGGRSDLLCTADAATLIGDVVPPGGDGDLGIPAPGAAWVLLALATAAVARSTRLRQP